MTTVTVSELTAGAADELSVWPASTTRLPRGGPAVAGVPLPEIADRSHTPAYVLDEGEVRARCRTYRDAFPHAEVLYAAKAFLSRAMVHWVAEEGLGLDVCSAGELELAVTAGFPPERILLHGNAKSPRDLDTALRHEVGQLRADVAGTRPPRAVEVAFPGLCRLQPQKNCPGFRGPMDRVRQEPGGARGVG